MKTRHILFSVLIFSLLLLPQMRSEATPEEQLRTLENTRTSLAALEKTKKLKETMDLVDLAKDPNPAELNALPDNTTFKQKEALDRITKVKDIKVKAGRFKSVGSFKLALKDIENLETLSVSLSSELDSSLGAIESLFHKNKDMILTEVKTQLSAMNAEQLTEEREARNALAAAKEKINKANGVNFILNLFYSRYELK